MKVSAAGLALIERREGRRLSAYRDGVGVLTIGVGHTGRMAPPPVTAGMTITAAQCDAFLAADLAPVEAAIARHVTVPISQGECDALASLGFNIGAAALGRSSAVRRLNLGDVQGAADAILLWSKPASLVARRQAERAQFLGADAGTARARAGALQHAATVASAGAASAATRAAATVGIGLPTAAVAAAAHHATAGLVAGALVLVAAALDGRLARARHARAATLAGNAGAHLDAVPPAAAA